MKLNINEWKDFQFKKFFKIDRGKRLIEEDRESGSVKYFSASQDNNGLTDHISNPLFIDKNALIYTTFGDCYYVGDEFTASDEISIFHYDDITEANALFIATIINQDKYKYSFGRKAFKNKYENFYFSLPIEYEIKEILEDNTIVYKRDKDNNKIPKVDPTCKYSDEGYIPDFKFMEEYIKSLSYEESSIKTKGVAISFKWK